MTLLCNAISLNLCDNKHPLQLARRHYQTVYNMYCWQMYAKPPNLENVYKVVLTVTPWWRHQMEAFAALLALFCWEFTGHWWFPSQRPVTCSFDVFFDLCLNKRLSKQLRSHHAHYDVTVMCWTKIIAVMSSEICSANFVYVGWLGKTTLCRKWLTKFWNFVVGTV